MVNTHVCYCWLDRNREVEMNPLVLRFHSLGPVRELLMTQPLPQHLLQLKISDRHRSETSRVNKLHVHKSSWQIHT